MMFGIYHLPNVWQIMIRGLYLFSGGQGSIIVILTTLCNKSVFESTCRGLSFVIFGFALQVFINELVKAKILFITNSAFNRWYVIWAFLISVILSSLLFAYQFKELLGIILMRINYE